MVEGIHTFQRARDRVVIANVADLQVDRGVEVVRPLAGRVHLRVEVVQRAHLVTLGEEAISEMGADEAGAAGDEDAHRGVRLATATVEPATNAAGDPAPRSARISRRATSRCQTLDTSRSAR